MPKKHLNISTKVMEKISRKEVSMRPQWYFVLGSVSLVIALVSLTIFSIFLISLISFSLRSQGPMRDMRLQILIQDFPYWTLFLAIFGVGLGIYLLKKYDFSYQKNFPLIIIGFILSVILAGLIIDFLDINLSWRGRGMMRQLYLNQQNFPPGGMMNNRLQRR